MFFPFVAGCSLKRAAAVVVGDLAWEGQASLEREQDVALARETTPSLIISLAVLGEGKPEDPTVAALLAKAYGQYAYGFLEEDLLRFQPSDEQYVVSLSRADLFYRRGQEAGLRALHRKRSFRRALSGPLSDFEHSLQSFGKGDAPLLFWTAFCWGGWINLHRDRPEAIVNLPRVTAMIDRVATVDPLYYFGLALSFRAVLDASLPPLLGGKPDRAREGFEAALHVAPSYVFTKVLYAQYYAVQVQDRPLFDRLLSEVEAFDPASFPEQRLAAELAKRRAELLKRKADLWF